MTEQAWLACDDPHRMLSFLGNQASPRKLRLLVCACCRRHWAHLSDRARKSVEAAEQFSDRVIDPRTLKEARGPSYSGVRADNSASDTAAPPQSFRRHVGPALLNAAWSAGWPDWVEQINKESEAIETAAQAGYVREVFNHPLTQKAVGRTWLSWRGGMILKLARAVYEWPTFPSGDLDTTRLAVLADALEEAGCDNADIVAHLRSPGPHVRGCWAVDLLLGKA